MQSYCIFLNLQIFQGCFFKKLAFFEKTVNEPTGQQVNETGGFGGVGRVGQVGQVRREMMVDEVTTWFLGNYLGGIRRFEHSWTYGLVDLLACGLFKIGVFPYLGGVICEKSSLFS